MASAHANGLPPNFILTPQQQALLFRALTSNQPNNGQNNGLSLSPASLAKSPDQPGANGVQESPFLDYDYSFGPDSSGFDFDLGLDQSSTMIGDLPGDTPTSEKAASSISDKGNSPENDIHDKRSHPDDGDDEEKEEGSAKRRESEGKVPKKPGRKPLTNEPSSVSYLWHFGYEIHL